MDHPQASILALARTSDPFPAVEAWVEIDGLPLTIASMRWREGLGRPYELELEIVSDIDLAPALMLGQPAQVTMRRGITERRIHGIVRSSRLLSDRFGRCRAALQIVPALALCGMNRRSRIFQDMTVPEIVDAVLRPALEARGSALDATRLAQTPRKRDYCVQYRESDLAFVERLLADESITYVFEHDGEREVVVLLDPEQIARPLETADGFAELEVREPDPTPTRESIAGIDHAEKLRPVRARARRWDWAMARPGPVDHAWQQPLGTQQPEAVADEDWAELELDIHDRDRVIENTEGESIDDGERVGGLLLGVEAVRTALVRVTSDAVGALPGAQFDLLGSGIDGPYVITEVIHHFRNAAAEDANARHTEYRNDITAIPADVPWQTPWSPTRPTLAGVQTATVIGPPGEDVHTDRHGRIRVLFHWDRDGRARHQSNPAMETSCWLRVVQSWAGPGHGAQFIPRVGTQVLVAFLDADPDRPICIGSLYDGHDRPPFDLPDERTRSGWRTRSTNGDDGYNELSFEDQVDREEIRLRAQRDLNETVLANHSTRVGGDRRSTVAGARTTTIQGSDELEVHDAKLTAVYGVHKEFVQAGPSTPAIPMPASVASYLHVVGGERYVQCSDAIRFDGARNAKFPPSIELNHDEIRFTVGTSSIVMKPDGIVIVSDGHIHARGGHAQMWLRPDNTGAIDLSAKTIIAASEGGILTMNEQVTLTAEKAIELARGESQLRLDERAMLGSQFVTIAGKALVEVTCDATCTIEGAVTEISGAVTRVEGTEVTVGDTAGGTIAVAGGIIRLN